MPIVHVAAVQDKVTALLRVADDAAASMNNELRVQLVKIPKQVVESLRYAEANLFSSIFHVDYRLLQPHCRYV